MAKMESAFERRARRNRYALRAKQGSRPRLSVFRSNSHISAQLIDDANGVTLAAVSTQQEVVAKSLKSKTNIEAAQTIGKAIAEAAKKAKVSEVVFDRGGYVYHGRVKALADAAREAGLKF